jgi:hypothetical protein
MTLSAPATVPVDSTLLANVAYDAGESLLYLSFRDGASYLYFSVSESVHQGLLNADSKMPLHTIPDGVSSPALADQRASR